MKVFHIKNAPALICDKCLKILFEVDQFRSKCLEANKYFQALKLSLEETNDQRETASYTTISPVDCESNTNNDSDGVDIKFLATKQSPVDKFLANVKETSFEEKSKKERNKRRYRPICGFCGKEQESEYRLRQHELLSHTPLNQLSPNEVFVCDLCARIFKTKQSMRNHFIRAHTPRTEKFPCSICGKVLPHQKALYAHERVHIKVEATCQYCLKTFSRKVLLSSHIAIVHLKKRLTQCQFCPHQAITGGALKKHIRCKHLNLRLHRCDWPGCGKSFHENQHLVRHYR